MFQSIGVGEEQVYGDLYLSWLRDTHEQNTVESKQLFREMAEGGFRDRQLVLRRQRLGVNVATSLSTMLHRAPLTRLDLHGNTLRDVGCDVLSHLMRDLPQLTYLDLGANDIQGSGMQGLSAVVAQHPKLTTLILGSARDDPYANRLTPASTALLLEGCLRSRTLRVLDLSGNQLGAAAYTRTGLDDDGDGESMNIADGTATAAGEGTERPTTGSEWSRANTGSGARHGPSLAAEDAPAASSALLAGGARGRARRPVHLLEQLLRTSSTLTTLRLKHVGLTNSGACALIAALHKNTVLTTLDLSYNDLSTGVCHALGLLLQERIALRSHTVLSALHMSGNDLFGNRARYQYNDFGVSRKLAAVEGPITTFTRSRRTAGTSAAKATAPAPSHTEASRGSMQSGTASEARDDGSGGDRAFGQFPSTWGQAPTLGDVGPSASGVAAAAAAAGEDAPHLLLAALGNDRSLRVLEMDECGMDDRALLVLCRALVTNGTLEVLALRDNYITTEGAVQLGRALCQHTTLQKLYLSGNVLEDEGVCAVATMLEKDDTLQVLDLQHTWLDDRGLIALGVALQTNHTLRVLLLSDNHFTHNGAEAFAAFLETNEHVLSCRLGATSVPHHTRLRIERATSRNTTRAENAEPDALKREVVRLHYQHYKLDEARLELEALRDKSAELKRSTENFELQFKQDQSDYLKRKRELEEQMENYANQEQRHGEQGEKLLSDLQKARAQHEEDMEVTQQRLQQETTLRESVEATYNEVEAELNDWKHNRAGREAKLEEELRGIKTDMQQWAAQRKEYREQIDSMQAAVAALEKQVAAKQPSAAAGGDTKKRASVTKKKKSTTTAS